MRFVDTNVLLYAVSLSPEDKGKRQRALDLLKESDLAVSVQVIQEFYHQATRPTRLERLTHDNALAFLGTLLRFPIQEVTLDVFRTGVAISQRFGLSYWDGAILAAARALGCDAVYSEDMSSDQDYDSLRVINPFDDVARSTGRVEQ
jgi:predicted nucleic acid-binding protein